MHPVGSYYTEISRCTVNKTLNLKMEAAYFFKISVYCQSPENHNMKVPVTKI